MANALRRLKTGGAHDETNWYCRRRCAVQREIGPPGSLVVTRTDCSLLASCRGREHSQNPGAPLVCFADRCDCQSFQNVHRNVSPSGLDIGATERAAHTEESRDAFASNTLDKQEANNCRQIELTDKWHYHARLKNKGGSNINSLLD